MRLVCSSLAICASCFLLGLSVRPAKVVMVESLVHASVPSLPSGKMRNHDAVKYALASAIPAGALAKPRGWGLAGGVGK